MAPVPSHPLHELVVHEEELCKYNNGACKNPRAMSKNGRKRVRMCIYHQTQANNHQRIHTQRKKLRARSLDLGSTTDNIQSRPQDHEYAIVRERPGRLHVGQQVPVLWGLPDLSLHPTRRLTTQLRALNNYTVLAMDPNDSSHVEGAPPPQLVAPLVHVRPSSPKALTPSWHIVGDHSLLPSSWLDELDELYNSVKD